MKKAYVILIFLLGTLPGSSYGGTIDELEIIQSFKLSDYSKIIVVPVDTSTVLLPKKNDNTYEPTKKVLSRMDKIFIKGLKKGIEDKLTIALLEKENEDNPENLQDGVLMIKVKVTEMNPRSYALRSLFGFGAGKTRVELKGEVLDAKTKTPLLKFKDARVSTGAGDIWKKNVVEDTPGSTRGDIGYEYEIILSNDAKDVAEDVGKMLLHF